jgi:hypothetical protein
MILLHCDACHHEWENDVANQCDWCGAGSYVLTDVIVPALVVKRDKPTKSPGRYKPKPRQKYVAKNEPIYVSTIDEML